MRDVIIWAWGAFTAFGVVTFVERTFKNHLDFAVGLTIVTVISAIFAGILFAFKIADHWNCEDRK